MGVDEAGVSGALPLHSSVLKLDCRPLKQCFHSQKRYFRGIFVCFMQENIRIAEARTLLTIFCVH